MFLLRCLATVVAMRCGLTLFSYRRMGRHIAGFGASDAPTAGELRRVAWGIAAVARLVPFASCLTQALAGQYTLARSGKVAQIRIGIERDTGSELRAHAWLISGPHIVLGGPASSLDRFAHLATLGGKP